MPRAAPKREHHTRRALPSGRGVKPTLLIDEADTFAKMNDELRGILNAGAPATRLSWSARRATRTSRGCSRPGRQAGRRDRPAARHDRGPRDPDRPDPEAGQRAEARRLRPRGRAPRLRGASVVSSPASRSTTSTRSRPWSWSGPDGLNDRAWNNWRPLFAIAEAAGGDWPDSGPGRRARPDRGRRRGEDVGTLALAHVWEVLGPAGKLATADVLRHLVSKDEGRGRSGGSRTSPRTS